MKYYNIIGYIVLILLITGCGSTYEKCEKDGYKGVVFYTDITESAMHCSNGDIIENGTRYLTMDGTYPIALNAKFLPFKE
jgi:hypothetical protein